jgi:glycosyltransferase involved in cell wall biosynthesis
MLRSASRRRAPGTGAAEGAGVGLVVTLSVIIPVHNERGSLGPLLADLESALDRIPRPSEIIVIDDGSTDGTDAVIEAHRLNSRRLRVLRLRRNFGQTAAMAAGFQAARGDVFVTMDGDGQNDPRDIEGLLADLESGYDVVSGWRRNRADSFFVRRLPSQTANRILAQVTGVPLHDFGCTLKAYRAPFIRRVVLYADMHRFIPGLAAAVGARVGERVVAHHPRRAGRSKYGLGRTYKLLTDMVVLRLLVRFAGQPLHYFGLLAIGVFGAALALTFMAFVDTTTVRLVNYSTVVMPSVAVLAFCLSFYFLMMGLMCELALRTTRPRDGAYVPMVRHESWTA